MKLSRRLAGFILVLMFLFGLGFWLYRGTARLPLPVKITSADKLAELHLVGGFGGFRDHLVVYGDGNASLLNDRNQSQKDFQVDSEKLGELKGFAGQLGKFSYESSDNPGGPDNLYEKLVFYGKGPVSNQPDQKQVDLLRALLNSILVQGKL